MKRLVLAIVALGFGCVSGGGVRVHGSGDPSCRAVCDYYLACKGSDDRTIHAACTVECTEIFYEDGKADTTSLRQFQQLACSDAIAFVEGSSGRPPGASARSK